MKEKIAQKILFLMALIAVIFVMLMTVFLTFKGTPALFKIGIFKMLFQSEWKPTAENASFGIAYIILTSVIGTFLSLSIGAPIAIFTAIFLSDYTNDHPLGRKISRLVSSAVELLASVPSVIYGLIGMMVLNPVVYCLEKEIFENSVTHQFTGGSNFLSAIIVLAIMIIPTVTSVSLTSIQAVSETNRSASYALGATKIQTIFRVVLPEAKSGIFAGVVLGLGRALGEAMAINMVAGSAVNLPLPFNSVRFLTTQIVSEMGYSSGLHREVLFTVGLILYIFIMLVNVLLYRIQRKGKNV